MKRTIIMFVLSGLVLVTFIVWALNSKMSGGIQEILMMAGGIIVVGFAIFLAVGRARSSARKEPPEDELSKKIMLKASALSYYISIYWWLFLMYISDRVKWESHTLVGAGILGMAIIFLLSWLWTKFFGFRYE
jgi:hypothetical protein